MVYNNKPWKDCHVGPVDSSLASKLSIGVQISVITKKGEQGLVQKKF